jgi:hypothetical protein
MVEEAHTPDERLPNGAVAEAWAILGKHPKPLRRDAVAACVEAGISPNTAKTQYQRWMHHAESRPAFAHLISTRSRRFISMLTSAKRSNASAAPNSGSSCVREPRGQAITPCARN